MAGDEDKVGFWVYWGRVVRRAWTDTLAFYPIFEDKPKAVLRIAVHVLAAIIFANYADEKQVVEELDLWLTFTLAATCMFFVVMVANGIMAPSRVDAELRVANAGLKEKVERRVASKQAAAPLRRLLRECDTLLDLDHAISIYDDLPFQASEWETEVIKTMRSFNLPEAEIHMFESIAKIPMSDGLYMGSDAGPTRKALEQKRMKLRLIIARLLDETED